MIDDACLYQAIGKTVSVTYQPRKDKTGIKKIVLADCETILTKILKLIKIENVKLSLRCATTDDYLNTHNWI